MGKSRSVFTPSGHFAKLYPFLVREPPFLLGFDTILVGTFFTPSGQKAPVTRGFPGDFAELYGSDGASLYQKSGADGQSRCLRRSILPPPEHFAKLCRYDLAKCIFAESFRNFAKSFAPYAFCLIVKPFLKVKTMLPSAFTVAFSTIAFQSWDVKSAMGAWVVFSAFRKFPMALRCILRL